MNFDINLRFQPSAAFIGILAELNEAYPDWTDGSYDWADQTTDFLHNQPPPPTFDGSLLKTPLSQRAVHDVLNMAIALLSGDYPRVRGYLVAQRYAFVIGYPRSGGSYLTKELLRAIGLEHTRVSEALAHDGFPDIRETWYDWHGDRPYYHLQHAIFEIAEFLVISHLYYSRYTQPGPDGSWLAPKKMHKLVAWASSFKMLLGQGRADYLVTVRHPIPAAISIADKSGGFPADGRFPRAPRSAIEQWIATDLMHLGYSLDEIPRLGYLEAVRVSWQYFYTRMATCGLFLADRDEIEIIPYDRTAIETVARRYRTACGVADPNPEPFMVKGAPDVRAVDRVSGDAAVSAVAETWTGLGLRFPNLACV